MMKGAFPPSSMETLLTVDADCARSCLPTRVEPVKLILRTMGLVVSSRPMVFGIAGDDIEEPVGQSGFFGQFG